MFYSITGTICYVDSVSVALDCNGVAFRCFTSLNTLKQIGEKGAKATLYTYLSVKEDALDLYGFSTEQELECFKALISVSGVGPKAGIAILSELIPEKLVICIASGDNKAITRAQGVGPKIAQRIVLELKDKLAKGLDLSVNTIDVSAVNSASSSGNQAEAVSALTMLGYTQSEASVAVAKIDENLSVEEIIKQALKILSRQV